MKICMSHDGGVDLSCFYDCVLDNLVTPMKARAALDKVLIVFAMGTNVSPIPLRDIVLGVRGDGYFVSYECRSRRDVCEYLALGAAEALERLPGVVAVVASFSHPVYELRLLSRSAARL